MISNDTYVYMDEANIHPLLKCKLCTKPLIEPVSTPNGDRCCRKCVSRIIFRESINESDKINTNENDQITKFQKTTPVTEPLVFEFLNSLLVRCTQCEAINIRRDCLHQHTSKECLKTIISCNAANIKCPWTGPREKLQQHAEECIFEPLRSALEHLFYEQNEIKHLVDNFERRINQ